MMQRDCDCMLVTRSMQSLASNSMQHVLQHLSASFQLAGIMGVLANTSFDFDLKIQHYDLQPITF